MNRQLLNFENLNYLDQIETITSSSSSTELASTCEINSNPMVLDTLLTELGIDKCLVKRGAN